MKVTKEKLNLENGLDKEWLITNGIGGYSSSTILGANTRRYHGLLVAALNPPGSRVLVLSKLDESLEIEGKSHNLYTNICKDNISDGYKYQEKFERNYVPILKYKVGTTQIIKMICLEHEHNSVGIYYHIKNGNKKAKLTLAPVINNRDFHSLSTNYDFNISQEIVYNKVKMIVNENVNIPIYMNCSEGNYIKHDKDIFKDMFYIEEEKRGFVANENLVVPGRYEIEINTNEEKEISFVCSLEDNIEDKNVKKFISNEIKRVEEIFEKSKLITNIEETETKTKKEEQAKNKIIEQNDIIRTYLLAADNFIVKRKNYNLTSIIAGYHWFLDWGRDTITSFEGLVLIPKRFPEAREILQLLIKDIQYGLIPNGYSEYTNEPLYNSADSSLLLFEAVQRYIDYTGDYKFIKQKIFHRLEEIIEYYEKSIDYDDNNIFIDEDGLVSTGSQNTQNTWMDAKFNGKAVTPRNGKVVGINALWYSANKMMEQLTLRIGDVLKINKYKKNAEKCRESFIKSFYNEKTKCLKDLVTDEKIRPNQLLALSTTYPVIDPISGIASNIMNVVEKKLLNSYGLKTLAKGEKNYIEIYEGSPEKRDHSYHQGITWPFLLGLYYNAQKNMVKFQIDETRKQEEQKKLDKFITKVEKSFKNEIYNVGCIGSIAELYDSVPPHLPKGTVAQGWSVAETFRIITRS